MSKTDIESESEKSAGWTSWLRPSRIPARGVLGILSFFGFFTNYMLRVNLNIAIVSMTAAPTNASWSQNKTLVLSECLANSSKHSSLADSQEDEAEFDWDTRQQGLVLGSFYWSYIVIMVPGGMVAEKYGGKLVYGGGNLLLCLMALAIPVAARMHISALILVRLIQGLAAGVTWPAMHVMASQWFPPHERSKFVSTYMGNSVGIAVTYPLCGVLIDAFGWESAFYVPGVLCLFWCVWWWFCAFDSPASHPRITKEELTYLDRNVVISKRKLKLPLKCILTSIPFWALVVANVGTIWAFMTIITYGPTYLKMVHGLSIRENGLLSGLPNLSRFLGSLFFSWVIDSMITSKKMTITFARKLATVIAQGIPAGLFFLMGNMGCNANMEVAVLTIASMISGSASSGTLVNSVDLAPNFSGSLLGLISIIGMSSGFVVPLVVGMIIRENQSMAQWRFVFIISAVLNVFTMIIFAIFGSGDVQSWNEPDVLKAQKKNRKILKVANENDSSAAEPLKQSGVA
ncbi:sialin-like [Neocloeon triangulifer]|uniref:sialin-like n=1 Tax=Neocloeon triangulifer TaxID=2078957 RepID=UPI00286F8109|nr:sialin-like [Neocloeon triangulifer]